MRVDATSIATMVQSLSDLGSRSAAISNSLSSGVRLNRLSDDASAAGQAVMLADAVSRDTAFVSTAATAGNGMQAADTALGSVVTQLTSAISTAVAAVDGTTLQSNRDTAVEQLKSIRESLLSLANSSYNGTYLFAGSSTAQPFTESASGAVTYTGNSNTSSVALASGGSLQSSLAGSSVFLASGASAFGALNDLITGLSASPFDSSTGTALVSNLRTALTNVTSQRAILNTAQNRLSSESDYTTTQKTNLQAQQSTLLSTDTASAATELSAITTQRNALLSTISIVEKGSLFEYL